jgi:hypothetical protein
MKDIIKNSFVRLLWDIHCIQISRILPFLKKSGLIKIYKIIILSFLILRHVAIILKNKDFVFIPALDLVLTTKCTLKCKDCSNLMPYYKESVTYTPEELIKDVEALVSAVDLIYEVRILGGEPFLYPYLDRIISKCLAERKIKKIRIITNGSFMPLDNCLNFLKMLTLREKRKILFFLSSYSVVATSIKNKIISCLRGMGYYVYVSQESAWRDEGKFNNRGFSINDLIKNYSTCSLCITLFNHEVSMCARAAHGIFLGLIPGVKTEQVKLLGCEPAYIRQNLKELFNKKFISTCNYCDNMKNIKIPVAVQLK